MEEEIINGFDDDFQVCGYTKMTSRMFKIHDPSLP